MPEDASLDAFASTHGETGDQSETDESESKSETDEQEPDAELSPDPAVSTHEWSPEGGECADCGASVERRWRADGERDGPLVCGDCKEW